MRGPLSRRAGRRRLPVPALFLLAAPLALDGQTITRGPYLQDLRETSVEVLWLTDRPSVGAVRYGQDPGGLAALAEPGALTAHRLKLAGLSPGTVYRYQVLDGPRVLAEKGCRFRTSPAEGHDAVRLAVIGDSGSADENQAAVAEVLKGIAPDLLLHTGDMDYIGDPDLTVFVPYAPVLAGAGFYPAMGNHDTCFYDPRIFFPPVPPEELEAIYYSFDYGSVHFVALDTNYILGEDHRQLRWLEADLEASRGARAWTVVFCHMPAYSVGEYAFDSIGIRAKIGPVLDRFDVDLVLTGHDHNYQRSHPVRDEVVHDAWQTPRFESPRGAIHVTTGGGGYSLYDELPDADHRYTARFIEEYHALDIEITASRLSVKAVAADRRILDEFTVVKGAARPELEFIRGDVDGNKAVDLADAIRILGGLFGGQVLECPLTADVNASGGRPNIADPVYLLVHLFGGGPPPAPPFPACGSLPGADDAWCLKAACPR